MLQYKTKLFFKIAEAIQSDGICLEGWVWFREKKWKADVDSHVNNDIEKGKISLWEQERLLEIFYK